MYPTCALNFTQNRLHDISPCASKTKGTRLLRGGVLTCEATLSRASCIIILRLIALRRLASALLRARTGN